jgi:hypothetical protein
LEDDESNAFNFEVDDDSFHAESAEPNASSFSSLETTIDLRALAPSFNLEGCHEIECDDFTKTAQRLQFTEQEASMSNLMHLYSLSSRSLSELLHDRMSTEDLYTYRTRSEATMSNSACPRSQPLHYFRASFLN